MKWTKLSLQFSRNVSCYDTFMCEKVNIFIYSFNNINKLLFFFFSDGFSEFRRVSISEHRPNYFSLFPFYIPDTFLGVRKVPPFYKGGWHFFSFSWTDHPVTIFYSQSSFAEGTEDCPFSAGVSLISFVRCRRLCLTTFFGLVNCWITWKAVSIVKHWTEN